MEPYKQHRTNQGYVWHIFTPQSKLKYGRQQINSMKAITFTIVDMQTFFSQKQQKWDIDAQTHICLLPFKCIETLSGAVHRQEVESILWI